MSSRKGRGGVGQSAAQRTSRRTGITALLLLTVTVTVTLVLARGYHLGIAAALVALLGGIPSLYLAWATYRDDRAEAQAGDERISLTEVADEIAVAVRIQWEAEAAVRRLNDPLLPVRWIPVEHLAEEWAALVALATDGAGWPAPAPRGWAAGAADLAGTSGDIARVLASIPTGRLVVLGEPGAGKTMLLVRLVLYLLERRKPGGPVPILASVSSWNPVDQDLHEWLAGEMIIDHPALAAPALVGPAGDSRGRVLLERGFFLPILDGLDEIPESLRSAAIAQINDTMRPGEALVLSSRKAAYEAAVHSPDGAAVTVRGAAVIEICPIDSTAASKYLLHDGGGKDRWGPVLRALGTHSPVGQALANPLMLSLAREIYNPRPGTYSGPLRSPAELCTPAMTSRELIERHLVDAFIPAAYRQFPSALERGQSRWPASDAERWLTFLACYLEYTIASPNFAWWQLDRVAPRAVCTVVTVATAIVGFGLTFAVMAGIAVTIPTRLEASFAVALLASLMVWFPARQPQDPMIGNGWSLRFVFNLAFWRRAGWHINFTTLKRAVFPIGAILTVLVFGFVAEPVWLVVGVAAAGIYGVYGDLGEVASPQALLRRDRRSWFLLGLTGVLYGAACGLVLGGALGRVIRALFDVTYGPALGISAGLVLGLTVALGFLISAVAWSRWRVVYLILAVRGFLPWRLVSFLQDAHRRGVLRQAGAVYQFRHIELQHRLATRIEADI
jgi:NACHT domain